MEFLTSLLNIDVSGQTFTIACVVLVGFALFFLFLFVAREQGPKKKIPRKRIVNGREEISVDSLGEFISQIKELHCGRVFARVESNGDKAYRGVLSSGVLGRMDILFPTESGSEKKIKSRIRSLVKKMQAELPGIEIIVCVK